MKSKYENIVKEEKKINGLIILKAKMGEMNTILSTDQIYNPSSEIVDIKIPLQFLVRNSKLQVKAGSKVNFNFFLF